MYFTIYMAVKCIVVTVEFADLPVIDLDQTQTPEGRAQLFPQVRDAFRTCGFIYAINHGYTRAQVAYVLILLIIPFTRPRGTEFLI